MKADREALAALEGKHLGQMSRYYETTKISLQEKQSRQQEELDLF